MLELPYLKPLPMLEDLLKKRDTKQQLSEDIKRILDIELKNENATVSKSEEGYYVNFPDHTMPFIDKQTLQKLVNHPNFKGIRVQSIEFKNNHDLTKDATSAL